MEGEPSPERQPFVSVTVRLDTARGEVDLTFTTLDTIVRTFSPEWSHMDYVLRFNDEHEPPTILYGYTKLADYLISEGFVHKPADVPERADQNMYAEYFSQRLDAELPGPDATPPDS